MRYGEMKNNLRNYVPILAYFLSSIALVLFQSSSRFSLWDFSNYTDLGSRISSGLIPYIDFPLYTQPGSFFEIALAIKLFGNSIFSVYSIILIKSGILGIIFQYLLKNLFPEYKEIKIKYQILILTMLSLTNPWLIIPQPTYDADISFAIMICTALIIGKFNFNFLKDSRFTAGIQIFIVTFATWFPFFYKQTSGLTWVFLTHAFIFFLRKYLPKHVVRNLILGDLILLIIGLVVQIKFNLIEIWKVNVIDYPLSERLNSQVNPISQFLEILNFRTEIFIIILFSIVIFIAYRIYNRQVFFVIFSITSSLSILSKFWFSYFYTNSQLDWSTWDKFVLLIFVALVMTMILGFALLEYSNYLKLLQLVLITTCSANFIAQGIVNSSYAFWQIYILVAIISLVGLTANFSSKQNYKGIERKLKCSYMFSLFVILISVSLYSFSQIRMSYIKTDKSISTFPKLYGWIGTPGVFLEETQVGIDLFAKYSKKGKTTVWPGEDPVSMLSGILPATNISTSDATTNPQFGNVANWLNDFEIEYVVWKTELQTPGLEESSNNALENSLTRFIKVEEVGVYQVLQRK